MRIQYKVSAPMRYFWLKNVTGINLSVHCARCLIGAYWPGVNGNLRQGSIGLPQGVYYLCGVSAPYVWERNFHLAFVAAPSETLRYTSNGVDVVVTGARRIEFSELDIDPDHPMRADSNYRTCRNWQFAHWLVANPEVLRLEHIAKR